MRPHRLGDESEENWSWGTDPVAHERHRLCATLSRRVNVLNIVAHYQAIKSPNAWSVLKRELYLREIWRKRALPPLGGWRSSEISQSLGADQPLAGSEKANCCNLLPVLCNLSRFLPTAKQNSQWPPKLLRLPSLVFLHLVSRPPGSCQPASCSITRPLRPRNISPASPVLIDLSTA